MVENCDFLKRLRNVHLEKSAVTGLFYPSCSPTTAKTPLKVHLRLRFQNLGKPRTAGLCGRAAGACDCGPLSCSTIERVNKGRKSLEQGMVRRKNTLPKGSFLHRRSLIHTDFSHIAHKRRNTRFNGLWRVHTPPQPLNAHTAAHRANGAGKRGAALRGTFEGTKSVQNAFKFGTEKNRGSRITAAKLRLPAKGGLTQFGGAAGPQARAAWTLLFPQS